MDGARDGTRGGPAAGDDGGAEPADGYLVGLARGYLAAEKALGDACAWLCVCAVEPPPAAREEASGPWGSQRRGVRRRQEDDEYHPAVPGGAGCASDPRGRQPSRPDAAP